MIDPLTLTGIASLLGVGWNIYKDITGRGQPTGKPRLYSPEELRQLLEQDRETLAQIYSQAMQNVAQQVKGLQSQMLGALLPAALQKATRGVNLTGQYMMGALPARRMQAVQEVAARTQAEAQRLLTALGAGLTETYMRTWPQIAGILPTLVGAHARAYEAQRDRLARMWQGIGQAIPYLFPNFFLGTTTYTQQGQPLEIPLGGAEYLEMA